MRTIPYAGLILVLTIVVALPPVAALAQASSPPPPGPDELLRQGIEDLTDFLGADEEPSAEQLRGFVDERIAPYFDFEYMASMAGGTLYRQLDAAGRARFTEKLRGLFLSALARNLGSQARPLPKVEVYPPRRGRWAGELRVPAQITPEDAYPMRLMFRFYRGAASWKVFDVIANNTSAVSYYRSYFNNMARRGGMAVLSR